MAFTKINAAGIGSTELVTLHSLEVLNNATVGGVLTYEDVTNVDSVGLITARNGIVVGSGITLSKDGDIFATGITTVSGNVKVGTGITLSPDGDIFTTGITTVGGFQVDSASSTEMITLDVSGTNFAKIGHNSASGVAVLDIRSEGHTRFLTGGNNERLRIASDGDVIITSADAGATGPTLKLFHNSASPADNDTVSVISMSGDDDAGNETEFASINTKVTDVSNGTEQAHLSFYTRGLGSRNEIFRLVNRSSASAPSYTTDDHNGIILDVYNTGNPYPRYMNFIAKSAGNTDSNIAFWTESVGGSPTEKLRITSGGLVGIGTDNPLNGLDVNQSDGRLRVNTYSHLLMQNKNSSDTDYWGISPRNGGELDIGYGTPDGNSLIGGDMVTIASDGNVTVTNGNLVIGTAGKGIDFSATGDAGGMSSEVLDDYEEGTFTPSFGFASDNFNGSYSFQGGYYTKIGRMVNVSFQIVATKGTAVGGTATIYNLPFTVLNADGGRASGSVGYFEGFSCAKPILILVEQNQAQFPLRFGGGITNATAINSSHISNSFRIYITITYSAA